MSFMDISQEIAGLQSKAVVQLQATRGKALVCRVAPNQRGSHKLACSGLRVKFSTVSMSARYPGKVRVRTEEHREEDMDVMFQKPHQILCA
jgi:hypothetical protein